MRQLRLIPIILLALLFTQCQKDVGNIGGPDPIPVVPEPISARLQGTVLDETGQPAEGVTVKLGAASVTTDDRGYFRIQNASLDKKSSMVSAEKTGYFKAFRTFAATSGTNQVIIKLIKKTIAGTVDATAGGDVTLSNGGKVLLPANGIVNAANNSSYTGTVNVYATYIDPTASDIDQTVPGSFMANDANGTRVTLASYGMMAVVLESASGEKLQIKSGSVSVLTTPIPSAKLASAPATIPLWYVDEQTGIWKEEGSATKQGNVYVGNVSHFSFWNCDIPMAAIVLSMTIETNNGDPLVYGSVRIKRTNPDQTTYGRTDSLGQVSGWVPANEALVLEVTDECGNAYYTQNIGPFSVNSSLNITLTPGSSASVTTVTGRLLDCSNNPVTNGYARVYFGYYTSYAATDANGNFSTNFSLCTSSPATVDVLGVDNAGMQQSSLSTVALVSPLTNVGDLIACGTSSAQFLNYTLDGTSFSIGSSPSDSLTAFSDGGGTTTPIRTYISGFQMSTNSQIFFSFNHTAAAAGTYPMTTLSVNNITQATPDPGSTVTITNFPLVPGEFYEGTFSATFNSGTRTLTGSFKIRR